MLTRVQFLHDTIPTPFCFYGDIPPLFELEFELAADIVRCLDRVLTSA